MTIASRTTLAALALAAAIPALSGCGETASTGAFKGESHSVAQTISDFQSDAMSSNKQKLCANDLAHAITARFKGSAGCEAAVKQQLTELDSFGLTIESISVNGSSAKARVKSTWSGKSRITTLSLVREGSRWKIAGAE
jgi:Putative lumazine-binding